MMQIAQWGLWTRDRILGIAQAITQEHAPGVVSLALVAFLVILLALMTLRALRRRRLLMGLAHRVQATVDAAEFQTRLVDIEHDLKRDRSGEGRQLAEAVAEFRETLIEPARNGGGNVQNSVRPSTFLNLEDLRFGLGSWRVWPGLFVSAGLLLTFLGLIAALAVTQKGLADGGGDQRKMVEALELLLGTASAKFIMSVTGLMCSIVFTMAHRVLSTGLERAVSALNRALEAKLDFISLEAIADRQLAAVREQTAQQQLLNTQLIAELSKPLERMTQTGTQAIGEMVGDLGRTLTANIGQSIERVAQQIDGAAATLQNLSSTLGDASDRFRSALENSTANLDILVQRLGDVSASLTASAESVAATTSPVMETARSTADTARALADGSVELVNAARGALDAERSAVVSSAKSIEELLRAFEGRAKAYDGQLEKAFATYVEQVQRTLGQLRNHSDGVHDRYAEALHVLQAVIENARAFKPESAGPDLGPVSDAAQ
jgi:uncharacterized protein YukE